MKRERVFLGLILILGSISLIIKKLGYKPRWNDEAPAIEFERSKNL